MGQEVRCEGTGHARNTSLVFRRGSALVCTQLAIIAFLVNGLPVLIGLAGFELHGSSANAADWGRGLDVTELSG
jgi:hypothetical protein